MSTWVQTTGDPESFYEVKETVAEIDALLSHSAKVFERQGILWRQRFLTLRLLEPETQVRINVDHIVAFGEDS